MIKFIKTKDKENTHDIADVEVVIEDNNVSLPDLLLVFAEFLRGCGYQVNGDLDIYSDDDSDYHEGTD